MHLCLESEEAQKMKIWHFELWWQEGGSQVFFNLLVYQSLPGFTFLSASTAQLSRDVLITTLKNPCIFNLALYQLANLQKWIPPPSVCQSLFPGWGTLLDKFSKLCWLQINANLILSHEFVHVFPLTFLSFFFHRVSMTRCSINEGAENWHEKTWF